MRREIRRERYDAVAIALHWLMAAGILALLAIGVLMTHVTIPPAGLFSLYQLHKSIGVTILLAAVARLGWRVTHRPPALPPNMPPTERAAATAAHWLLYALLIGLPLTGWVVVSVSPLGIPTMLYGLMRWPHLPFLADVADKVAAEKMAGRIHAWGAYSLAAIVAIHAAAALRHHLLLGDDVLGRMVPFLRLSRRSFTGKARP